MLRSIIFIEKICGALDIILLNRIAFGSLQRKLQPLCMQILITFHSLRVSKLSFDNCLAFNKSAFYGSIF